MTGLELTTNVLVVGGGPATTGAALKAAQVGADVVLAPASSARRTARPARRGSRT